MGITAPLPRNFRHICAKFDIPIPQDIINGGIFIDGVKVEEEGLLPPGAGRWLPSGNPNVASKEEETSEDEILQE